MKKLNFYRAFVPWWYFYLVILFPLLTPVFLYFERIFFHGIGFFTILWLDAEILFEHFFYGRTPFQKNCSSRVFKNICTWKAMVSGSHPHRYFSQSDQLRYRCFWHDHPMVRKMHLYYFFIIYSALSAHKYVCLFGTLQHKLDTFLYAGNSGNHYICHPALSIETLSYCYWNLLFPGTRHHLCFMAKSNSKMGEKFLRKIIPRMSLNELS